MAQNLQVCLKRGWTALHHAFSALCPTYNSCKVWFYFNRHVVKNQQWLLKKRSSNGCVFHCSVNHKNKASHTFPYSHVFTVLPSFLISLFISCFLVSIYIPGRIPPFNFTSFPLPVTNRNMAKVILIYHFWIALCSCDRASRVKREERIPTRCNNMIYCQFQMLIIDYCLDMFWASLCRSSGEKTTCHCIWVLAGSVGCGWLQCCGATL